jgi:membrane-associated phospholipid phosphatase
MSHIDIKHKNSSLFYFNMNKKFTDMIFRDLTTFGGEIFYLLVLTMIFAIKEITLFWNLLLGNIFAIAIVVLIRVFYFKPRPHTQTFSNLIEKIDASSFPSLHTARIWFVAFIFMKMWGFSVGTVVSILAILVTYSRVYLKKHDWVDVSFGFILAVVLYLVIPLI